MRNLYKYLRIGRNTEPPAIADAVSRCSDQSIRNDAKRVLLDENAREVYDRNHQLLMAIGQVRSEMNILNTPNWGITLQRDFTPMPHSQKSATSTQGIDEIMENVPWSVVIIICGVILGVFAYFLFDPDPTESDTIPDPVPTYSELKSHPKWATLDEGGKLRAFDRWSTEALRAAPPVRKQELSEWIDRERQKFDRSESTDKSQSHELTLGALLSRGYNSQKSPLDKKQPLPPHGTYRVIQGHAVAPLTIQSQPGFNYYVKLVADGLGHDVVTIFIHGGHPVQLKVPLGVYRIKYATGTDWQGEELLFGAKTEYSEASKTFRFTRVGNQISGYTLTLYKVINGNLSTRSISANQF